MKYLSKQIFNDAENDNLPVKEKKNNQPTNQSTNNKQTTVNDTLAIFSTRSSFGHYS